MNLELFLVLIMLGAGVGVALLFLLSYLAGIFVVPVLSVMCKTVDGYITHAGARWQKWLDKEFN